MLSNNVVTQSGRSRSLNKSRRKTLLPKLIDLNAWLFSRLDRLSQRVKRVYMKHGISPTFRLRQTLRNILVHPKDKRDISQTANCVYEFPCRNCDKTSIGETSCIFGARLKEHKSEAEKASSKAFTWATRKASITGEPNKSTITNHVMNTDHVIG